MARWEKWFNFLPARPHGQSTEKVNTSLITLPQSPWGPARPLRQRGSGCLWVGASLLPKSGPVLGPEKWGLGGGTVLEPHLQSPERIVVLIPPRDLLPSPVVVLQAFFLYKPQPWRSTTVVSVRGMVMSYRMHWDISWRTQFFPLFFI